VAGMLRVRHYTRISSMRKIMDEQRIIARDQNKIFVELASARRLSASDAEDKYELKDGKGNAYVEFDVEPELLQSQYNRRTKLDELFIVALFELAGRNAAGAVNF
jgi:hypothetical protein